jgi:7-cyano-7-deazaguanine synthase
MKTAPTIDAAMMPGQGGPSAPTRRAVVLLSGGLDSATAAAWARGEGYLLTALSVSYGQRHAVEIDAARAVAIALGITDHVVLAVDLAAFGGSALVDPTVEVPKGRSDAEMACGIPVTYVPARNTVFLSLSLALAEARGAEAIVLGVNAIDYSGYPDCRPEYLAAFETLARLATKAGIEGHPTRILAPLVSLTKAEIIRLGHSLGVEYGLTTSCYDPLDGGWPCGRCDSCLLRAAGFAAAGLTDPRCRAAVSR